MLVGKGALTFRTYRVAGKKPAPSLERVLERLETFAFSGLGDAEEGSVTGWVAPEHLFDGGFDIDKIVRGPYVVFALRMDTRKVSGPVLAAHTALEIEATLEAEGLERLGRARKSELKQAIRRRLLKETPPVQKAYGVFWNLRTRRVFLQSTSKTVTEAFRQLFERTFELELVARVPGLVASEFAEARGVMETLQDARPLSVSLMKTPESDPALVA